MALMAVPQPSGRLGERFGVSADTVLKSLRRAGVAIRPRQGGPAARGALAQVARCSFGPTAATLRPRFRSADGRAGTRVRSGVEPARPDPTTAARELIAVSSPLNCAAAR